MSSDQTSSPAQPAGQLGSLIARLIVGVLFVVSAVGKIVAPLDFAKEIRAYEMVPIVITNAMAYILPWIELLAGLMLVACVWRREARLVIGALLVVFTIAKTWTYVQGKVIDCGCGGQITILKYIYNSPQGIATNLVLLGLLWYDARAQRRRSAPLPAAEAPPAASPDE